MVGWWEGSPAILAAQLKVRFIYSELVGGRSQPTMWEALVAFHSTQLQYTNQFMKTLRLSFERLLNEMPDNELNRVQSRADQ